MVGDAEVVHRRADHDGVGGAQLGDERVGEGAGGVLGLGRRGAADAGEVRLGQVRHRLGAEVAAEDAGGLAGGQGGDRLADQGLGDRGLAAGGAVDDEDGVHGAGSLRDVISLARRICSCKNRDGSRIIWQRLLQKGERSMPDLDDIRAFAEVADSGSLTRAGARLGMSKSMISRRLARLEAELGATLLARTTRGMSLTEAGGDFRPYAERMRGRPRGGARRALAAGRGDRPAAADRAGLASGRAHLAPVIAELAVRHPQLAISTSYSDRLVDLVGEGFDAAIRLGNLADSSLIARRIAPVRAVLVASPAYLARAGTPRTPGDLAGHEAIPHGDSVWEFVRDGRRFSHRPRGRFTADSGAAELAGVVAGPRDRRDAGLPRRPGAGAGRAGHAARRLRDPARRHVRRAPSARRAGAAEGQGADRHHGGEVRQARLGRLPPGGLILPKAALPLERGGRSGDVLNLLQKR